MREPVSTTQRALRWRSVDARTIVFDIVSNGQPLPRPLATAASNGLTSFVVRFPEGRGGLAQALMHNRAGLPSERFVLTVTLLEHDGTVELHPVLRIRVEGSIRLEQWLESAHPVEGDPAPYSDLIDEIESRDLRRHIGRGVLRAVKLAPQGAVASTWELAAVTDADGPVRDWQASAERALADGDLTRVEGWSAIIRENAFGRRKGDYIYAVPFANVLLAAEIEQEDGRWEWSGLAFGRNIRPPTRMASLPEGLPAATLRIETVRDRRYRSGLSRFQYALIAPLSKAYAWLVGQVMHMSGDDEWRRRVERWKRGTHPSNNRSSAP